MNNNYISYKTIVGAIIGLLILVGGAWASMIQSEHSSARERLGTLEANISGIDQHNIDIEKRLDRLEGKIDSLLSALKISNYQKVR